MSSICTVLGPKARQFAETICKNLTPVGAGDENFFFADNVALGHKAIRIDSMHVSHQPLANEDETMWITFDGKIYNKERLKRQLAKNHAFETNSSAEVVIHAYEDHRFDCLREFNGMFAFCLWDSKSNWLFLARDRLGMKPLYYYKCEDLLILASEISGILAAPSVSRKPNEHYVYEYLVTGYPSSVDDTFFIGIKELTPAHYVIVEKDEVRITRYWQPTQRPKTICSKMDDRACSTRYLHLLQKSINIRLPRNLPVGTLLSGGLDSTSIAALVEELLKSSTSTTAERAELQEIFSAIYNEPTEQGDERCYIKQVEHALGKKSNYIFPSVAGKWKDIKHFVLSIEEPVAVFNYYVFWCLFQAAKQKVNIVFSGQGNDAILGGQTEHVIVYFRELVKTGRMRQLIAELVRSLDWILPYLIWTIFFSGKAESRAESLLAPRFIAAYSQAESSKESNSLQDALLNDVTRHAVEYLRVDNRASSTFSVECRHPFLDHRIVEFAFSLPANQKFRDGWTKYVMRNAVKGLIPEAIRTKRKKFGTPIPQQRWMRQLRRNIREILESRKFRERGYFNQPAILNVFDRYCEGKLDRVERRYYADVLWRIINLELWLEAFFD